MTDCPLTLADTPLLARASGALWMPEQRALIVSDLHLGKAERNARRGGGFWPPYENDATLARLETEVAVLDPAMIVALGDSFDDSRCVEALAERDCTRISALVDSREMIWITGNHDPAPNGLPGRGIAELTLGTMTFRHIADGDAEAEVSGHYHPKATIHTRGRRIRRKCFLLDAQRIILPAFARIREGWMFSIRLRAAVRGRCRGRADRRESPARARLAAAEAGCLSRPARLSVPHEFLHKNEGAVS